jgi:hypothetical protein
MFVTKVSYNFPTSEVLFRGEIRNIWREMNYRMRKKFREKTFRFARA